MGFFDNLGSFFTKDIPNFFTKQLPQAAGKIYHQLNPAISTVYNDAKSGISAVHQDIRDYASGVSGIYNHGIDAGKDVIKGAENTVSNLGQSLSFPLVLAGGAAALYFLNKR
jgi:hypothetical protein